MVYLDNVIIFSKTFERMLVNLREVFLRLQEANLKLNLKKYHFFGREIKYLGHVVSESDIFQIQRRSKLFGIGRFFRIKSK